MVIEFNWETYPCLEELVVDLQQTGELYSYLLHGEGDKAHVPIQMTHLLLQKLHQEFWRQDSGKVLYIKQFAHLCSSMVGDNLGQVLVDNEAITDETSRPYRHNTLETYMLT